MVKNPGAPSRAHRLRALNEPRPITVIAKEDRPVAIIEKETQHRVASVQDTWIVQDEWWRKEIHRQYYRLVLGNDTTRTIYHDRITDAWYEQAY